MAAIGNGTVVKYRCDTSTDCHRDQHLVSKRPLLHPRHFCGQTISNICVQYQCEQCSAAPVCTLCARGRADISVSLGHKKMKRGVSILRVL